MSTQDNKMSSAPHLTPRDMELLSIAFQCLQDPNGLKVDYKKFAELASLKNVASASASFLVVKKKILAGASGPTNGDASSIPKSTLKKKGGKAQIEENNGAEGDDHDDGATTPKVAHKKRKPKAKAAAAENEGGDLADTEKSPDTEIPKKRGKAKATNPSSPTVDGEDTPDASTVDGTPPKKRTRGPNKPKDPNAPPTKRGKKNNGAATTANNDEATNTAAANAQLHGGEASYSMFGEGEKPENGIKNEIKDEDGDEDRIFTGEEQKLADERLFGTSTNDDFA
ncbi:hypothetical protein MMC28_009813 [Mycoblastus sanguinarius]|nr:hypothetical protein [Mycoblastus sanguinarius]